MRKLYSLFVLILLFSSVAVQAQGAAPGRSRLMIQTLDNYVVSLDIDTDNNARVRQSFDIVNRYREPIIPGRAKMVIFGNLDPTEIEISIGGSRRPIPDEAVVLEDGNRVIYYEIWRPVDINEKLRIEVNFRTQIDPQGVLFKQLNLNFGEPDLVIEKMALSVSFPPGNRLTYSNLPVSSREGNTMMIEIPREMIREYQEEPIIVEYSTLPLPLLPFNGYWLWLTLIILSAAIMALKLFSRRNIETEKAAIAS